jgi:LPXTG-motif cell wall-anchored protein
LKKVMLLAAVVAMVLAAAVPAWAQTQAAAVAQEGNGNIACVQQAMNNNNQVAVSQYGDAININAQAISQNCNITVEQANAIAKKAFTVNKAGEVVVVKKAAPDVVVKKAAPDVVVKKAAADVQYKAADVQYKAAAPSVVQYQYQAAAVQYQYASAKAAAAPTLPETGGSSLIALGVGVLLVAGGLLARRIVR